jgi:hypothetical protein
MNETRSATLALRNRFGASVTLGACLFASVAMMATAPSAMAQVCALEPPGVCAARQSIDCTVGAAGETCVPLTLSKDSLNNIILVNQCTCADPLNTCAAINITGTGASTAFRCGSLTCDTSPDPCSIYVNGVSTGNNSILITDFAIDDMLTCGCDVTGGICPPPPAPLLDLCDTPALQVNCDTPGGTSCDAQNILVDGGTITATQCMCNGPGVGCGPVFVTPLPNAIPPDVSFRCLSNCAATGDMCRIFVDGAAVLPLTDSILQSVVEADGLPHNVTCECPPVVSTCNPQGGPFWCAGLIDTDCVGGTGTDTCYQTALTVAADGTPLISQCACFEGGQCGIITIVENVVPPATSPYTFVCEKACPDPNDTCEVHLDGVPQGTVIMDSNMVPPGQTLSCGCVPPDTICPLPLAEVVSCASLQLTQCVNPNDPAEECRPTSVTTDAVGDLVAASCECNTFGSTCLSSLHVWLDAANEPIISCNPACTAPTSVCIVHVDGVSTGQLSIPGSSLGVGQVANCNCTQVKFGACCLDQGAAVPACFDNISQPECEDAGGSFYGGGTVCLGTQACCNPTDGTCQDMDALCCTDSGGIPQGSGSDCTMTNICSPPLCPVSPTSTWCDALQATDCAATVAGTTCLPSAVAIDAAGNVAVNSCDCAPDGECGPVTIVEQPGVFPPYLFTCNNTCPDPNDSCEIHIDGVPQGLDTVGSNWVPNGQTVTCGCVQPDPTCPLPGGGTIPLCQDQLFDCTNPTSTLDECLPTIVFVGPNFTLTGAKCKCLTQGDVCDPVDVVDIPGAGISFSCEAACPDPTTQECLVHINGVSTGLVSIPQTATNIDDAITCDCLPQSIGACCSADAAGIVLCQDNMSEAACDAIFGVFHLNQTCLGTVACCRPDGTCSDVDALCCADFGGVPQATGSDCTLANMCDPPFCPLVPGDFTCANFQFSDCAATGTGTNCTPSTAAVDLATGVVVVTSCDCFDPGECGPLTIVEQPGVFPPYLFTCENNCPDPDDSCEVHIDGVPQGVTTLGSNWVPNGQTVSCGCVQPDPSCPLPSAPALPICQNNTTDCTNPVLPTDECLPEVVIIGANGLPVGEQCLCATLGDTCGPVNVSEEFGFPTFSCEALCPDPTNQNCLVHLNGTSTGLVSIDISAVVAGDVITCNCQPQELGACCSADAAGQVTCQDNVSEAACDAVFGVFHLNQSCLGLVACCRPNGTCQDVDELCCKDFGGVPQAPGSDCSLANMCDPPFCPIPDANLYCVAHQADDCPATGTNSSCLVADGIYDPTTGTFIVDTCDCFNDGECGPVTIIEQPGAFPPMIFTCKDVCPATNEKCEIHLDGVPQGITTIGSNWVSNGQIVSCDCVTPDLPCPLPSGDIIPVCDAVQMLECSTPSAATDECLPKSVALDGAGGIAGAKCACITDDGTCGPVGVIDTPIGITFSCEAACPDPDLQTCLVHQNGVSTGAATLLLTDALAGALITCDCLPQTLGACCSANAAGQVTCQDGVSEVECDSIFGIFHANESCLGLVACCRPNGTCADIDALCCEDFGGVPQAAGTDCSLANMCDPPYCPVSPNVPWCADLQATDCPASGTGTNCLPNTVAIDVLTGGLVIDSCDCYNGGECGPVSIFEQPGAFPPYIFTCENNCPDPNDACEVHIDGVPQGVVALGSNWVQNGQLVSCDCVTPVIACPLPSGDIIPLCQPNQLVDCSNPTTTADECLPTVISVAADGSLLGEKCECAIAGEECGPVKVIDTAVGIELSCESACPDPTTQNCLIHIHGMSTGSQSISASSLAADDVVTCECVPDATGACCIPLNVNFSICQDGLTDAQCSSLAGSFHDNQSCLGFVACCMPDGTCQTMDALCCQAEGGTAQPAGSDCTQANMCNPPLCPMPINSSLCANLQATDCQDAGVSSTCRPYEVAVGAGGAVDIQACDCFEKACGPVGVVDIPIFNSPILYCLPGKCKDVNGKCELHIDGVAQGVTAVFSVNVSSGSVVTCDCVTPPIPCGSSAFPVCNGTCPQPFQQCKAQGLFFGSCKCKTFIDVVLNPLKSYQRSLGVILPSTSAGALTAYRVSLTTLYAPGDPQPINQPDYSGSEGEVRYLNLFRDTNGVPVTECLSSAAFGTTYPCISVGCEPEYVDWGTLFGDRTAYLMGNAIIPDSTYTIAHLDATCAGQETTCVDVSAEVAFATARHGDTQRDDLTNVNDVVNVVDVTKDVFGAPWEYQVYVRNPIPAPHLESVNVTDIVIHVDAVKLVPYTLPITSCP